MRRALRCDSLAGKQDFLFAGLQTGGLDLADLVSKEINFAGGALFVEKDGGLFILQVQQGAARAGELLTKAFCAGKAVEQMGLLIARKEALVVVRAVKIDEKVAQGTQHGEGAGRTVHELPARALSGQYSLKKEAPVFARLCAVAGEEGRDSFIVGVLKDGLDRASVRTRANEVLVRPLSKDKRQRAKNDGFSRSGLSSDGDESRPGLPEQFFDKSEVANAQRGERCGHGRTMP